MASAGARTSLTLLLLQIYGVYSDISDGEVLQFPSMPDFEKDRLPSGLSEPSFTFQVNKATPGDGFDNFHKSEVSAPDNDKHEASYPASYPAYPGDVYSSSAHYSGYTPASTVYYPGAITYRPTMTYTLPPTTTTTTTKTTTVTPTSPPTTHTTTPTTTTTATTPKPTKPPACKPFLNDMLPYAVKNPDPRLVRAFD